MVSFIDQNPKKRRKSQVLMNIQVFNLNQMMMIKEDKGFPFLQMIRENKKFNESEKKKRISSGNEW